MLDSGVIISSILVLGGFFGMVIWFFRKMARGEISLGVNAALLALLGAILLVPFAMNFSAHLISGMVHHSDNPEDSHSHSSDH